MGLRAEYFGLMHDKEGEEGAGELTRVLAAVERGEDGAETRLMRLVYEELRGIAAAKMAREDPDHTLQPTALVHEAWLRMGGGGAVGFVNRAHFFAVAGEAMRRILIESARRKMAVKRGARRDREPLREDHRVETAPPEEVLAVGEALELLAREDRKLSELVCLRYFAGMTMEEAALGIGVSVRTAERMWTYGRAWLRRTIGESLGGGGSGVAEKSRE